MQVGIAKTTERYQGIYVQTDIEGIQDVNLESPSRNAPQQQNFGRTCAYHPHWIHIVPISGHQYAPASLSPSFGESVGGAVKC